MSERAIQDNNMKKFFAACEIITEGYDDISILNEGVGDNLKNGWNKFVQFIKETFAKFAESMSNIFQTEKSWLEQYKDIILKKKPDENMSFDDFPPYDVGIQRISKATVPLFNPDGDANSLKDVESFITMVCPDISQSIGSLFPDGIDKNTSTGLTTYFKGGESRNGVKATDLNMTDLWNFCYNYKTLTGYIEKDNRAIMSSVTNANKAITTAIENLDQKQKQTNAPDPTAGGGNQNGNNSGGNGNGNGTQVDPKESLNTKNTIIKLLGNITDPQTSTDYDTFKAQIDKATKEYTVTKDKLTDTDKQAVVTAINADIDKLNNSAIGRNKGSSIDAVKESVIYAIGYITEAIKRSPTDNSASKNNSSTSGVYSDKTTQANKQNVTTSEEDRNKNADNAMKNNNNDATKAVEEITNKLNVYQKCVQDIMVSKSAAIQTIFKDYMTVMREHVRSIVGKESSTAAVAQQASTNTVDSSKYTQVRFNDIDRARKAYNDAADGSVDKKTKLDQYVNTIKRIYGADQWSKQFANFKDDAQTAEYFATTFLNKYNAANNTKQDYQS
jgi:hypothetical protein